MQTTACMCDCFVDAVSIRTSSSCAHAHMFACFIFPSCIVNIPITTMMYVITMVPLSCVTHTAMPRLLLSMTSNNNPMHTTVYPAQAPAIHCPYPSPHAPIVTSIHPNSTASHPHHQHHSSTPSHSHRSHSTVRHRHHHVGVVSSHHPHRHNIVQMHVLHP